ncbi:cytochrome P450 [Streptomyces incanus]|uniref:Cytochrome P450 n=1 Tax=Streptomyces incanus TaxID=887453 RepID=A0ABW0XZB7_9ACTN
MTSTQPTEAESPLDALPGQWRSIREAGPVTYDEAQDQWRVVDHRGVSAVLADPGAYSSGPTPIAPTQQDFETFRQGGFAGMDPPEHRTLRALVSQAFTPGVVPGPEPRIEAVCARLLDGVADRDRFDLADTLAHSLPITVIAELPGVPADDPRLFQERASPLFGGDQLGDGLGTADLERALEATAPTVRETNGYALDRIRHRRAHPGGDLTSRPLTAEVDGTRPADEEIAGWVALLLVAGHITTTALLGDAVVTFDRHPGTLAALRENPGRLPDAVEEVPRLLPPFPERGRRTTRPVVLGGVSKVPHSARGTRHAPPSSRLRSSREVPPSPHRPKAQVRPVRGLSSGTPRARTEHRGHRTGLSKHPLGGHEIPADTLLMVHLSAADRDPSRFTDPDVFDVARGPNPHPTFGHGIHFCFGAPLARLEARITPHMQMERFPAFAVPSYDDVAYQNPAVIVGVRHLPTVATRP